MAKKTSTTKKRVVKVEPVGMAFVHSTFNNVIVTSHQAYFTKEALSNIATTTLQNVRDFTLGKPLENEVKL